MSEPSFEIPSKCSDCLHVQAGLDTIECNNRSKEFILASATDGTVEFAAREMTAHSAELGLPDSLDEDSLGEKLRIGAAEALDKIDETNLCLEAGINELVTGCNGLLRMRAKRDGVTYTVPICTSPIAPIGNSIETVEVNRQI